ATKARGSVGGALGLPTIACKAAGPVLVGRRQLPPRLQACVELLAPVMLTALVVTQTFGGDEEIEVDARLAGVGAGLIAIARRAPVWGGGRAAPWAPPLWRLAVRKRGGPPPCQNPAAAAIASATRLTSPI